MGRKTKPRRGTHALACRGRRSTAGEPISLAGWLVLIVNLPPKKIRALGVFFLFVAVAFRILIMPFHYVHEGYAIPSWEEAAIITALSSILFRGRAKLKTR